MRDSGRKLAHRFQLLRLEQLLLQRFALGHVFAHAFIADQHAVLVNGAGIHRQPESASILAIELAFEALHRPVPFHQALELLATLRIDIILA